MIQYYYVIIYLASAFLYIAHIALSLKKEIRKEPAGRLDMVFALFPVLNSFISIILWLCFYPKKK